MAIVGRRAIEGQSVVGIGLDNPPGHTSNAKVKANRKKSTEAIAVPSREPHASLTSGE
jgi:hypothetical protein